MSVRVSIGYTAETSLIFLYGERVWIEEVLGRLHREDIVEGSSEVRLNYKVYKPHLFTHLLTDLYFMNVYCTSQSPPLYILNPVIRNLDHDIQKYMKKYIKKTHVIQK